ncbi:hypothetical protein BCAR13_10153 [Paraburkholderia caribensis]|nr:hypothetical protein BCAR13_10153 [Paraburkholderia caribensis]
MELGTAMVVNSLDGAGAGVDEAGVDAELSPPPHAASTAVATSRTASNGFFISRLL